MQGWASPVMRPWRPLCDCITDLLIFVHGIIVGRFRYMQLPKVFNENGTVNAVIETPAGSNVKYNYVAEAGTFKLKKVLPAGTVFPIHFGFLPHTVAGDGDPLDIIVLLEGPSWPGCIIECRVVGVVEADQVQDNKRVRNDRIIGIAVASRQYQDVKDIEDLENNLLPEINNFLQSYTRLEPKDFRILGNKDVSTAISLIKESMQDGDH